MIRAGLAATALVFTAGSMPAPLIAPAAISADDAVVLRTVLAELGPEYCVTTALGEAPFAGLRRDIAEHAETEAAMAALEKRPPRMPRTAGEREQVLRERIGWGWLDDARKPVDAALLARLTEAATRIALRGDPTPLPADANAVVDLNIMDSASVPPEPGAAPADDALEAEADRLEALADATVPPVAAPRDHGRIERGWLARGQRMAADCPLPSASLSALARDGEFAFVSVGTVWGPLAGHGETWAMQRTARGWRRVARRQDWIA